MGRLLGVSLIWAAMVVAQLQGFQGCVEEERVGLLALSPMKGINTSSDCCLWVGVNCSATTGRVERLSLYALRNNESLESFLNISLFLPFQELMVLDLSYCDIRGLLHQADFAKIRSLKYLDISYNRLNISLQDVCKMTNIIELNLENNRITGPLPDCVGNMTMLQFLNLGYNMLSGNMPLTFGNLSHLRYLSLADNSFEDFVKIRSLKYLDIRSNRFNINLQEVCKMNNIIEFHLGGNSITGPLPDCVGNMTKLQFLNLDNNRLSGNIPPTIGNLSHLRYLSLAGNYFEGSFSLSYLAYNSKLVYLDLFQRGNNLQLETETPTWFPSFQLKFLQLRNLNINRLSNSVIPSFLLHQYDLRSIDISHNKLEGSFPSWLLQNNSELSSLFLSGNSLTRNLILPDFIHVLENLDISSNKIDGKLPDGIGLFLPRLLYFDISRNGFEDNLPSSLGELQVLDFVDFSFNNFSGELPKNLFARSRGMTIINLSNNRLRGKMSLNLTNFSSLTVILLNNNEFNGTFEDGTIEDGHAPTLNIFDISNNMISGRLPSWIKRLLFLRVLKVSDNYLEGDIPVELCKMNDLFYLDISRNMFSGSIPSCLSNSSLKSLFLRENNLSGAIPNGFLNNSHLVSLDLSYNDFSNRILPNWIYSLKNMQILLMAGMQLEGEISMQLCTLEKITIMDLSHNHFNGSIPSCLFEMPFWIADIPNDSGLDLGIDYNFLGSGTSLIGDILNSTLKFPIFSDEILDGFARYEVKFTTKGTSLNYQKGLLNYMTGLDLSNNKLSGQIPTQIEYSQALRSLNLSDNQLWGSIPNNISKMRLIESLDLSSNNLSGQIPSEIVHLNFIAIFNVSNNNLSGPTPTGGEFSNFDESNYGGNEYLCGPLLHRDCTSSSPSTPSDEQRENETETGIEMTWFWWTFVASYIFVVVAWAIVLGINPRCCRGLFRMVDVFCLKLYSIIIKS